MIKINSTSCTFSNVTTGKFEITHWLALYFRGTVPSQKVHVMEISVLLWDFLFIYVFIYLAAPGLGCGTQDLVPGPGIEPGPPALGRQSLSHWTTREVPGFPFQMLESKVDPSFLLYFLIDIN